MRIINNVLSIPEKQGFFIGRPVQAYLDHDSLRVAGFLCQLFGLPARLVYYPFERDKFGIKRNFIEMKKETQPILIKFEEITFFKKNNKLISLKDIPLLSRGEGLIGFLKNFKITNETSLNISSVNSVDEEWGVEEEGLTLEKVRDTWVIVIDRPLKSQGSIEYPFFDKKVIQSSSHNSILRFDKKRKEIL